MGHESERTSGALVRRSARRSPSSPSAWDFGVGGAGKQQLVPSGGGASCHFTGKMFSDGY